MKKENGVGHVEAEEKHVTSLPSNGDCQSVRYDPNISKQQRGNVHFKILVPSIAAGAIIGKGGEAITDIQNQTSAKVKMSKANAFYPGTTERVCLIVGTIESILRVFHYISEKIYEKPEPVTSVGFSGKVPFERHKQVKILVPNSTAGMIIGKAGSFIKQLKDTLGVFIQVSQKSEELSLTERCVTVAGELSQTRSAVAFILNKISEDPQSSSCPNISYSELTGPVASAYPIGSPYALAVSSNSCLSNCGLNFSSNGHYRTTLPGPTNNLTRSLTNYSPLNPSNVNHNSNSLFATTFPPAIAAALAAMSAIRPFSPEVRSSYGSSSGRALMGRGMATGHQSNSQQTSYPQSLLGNAGLHFGTGVPVSCTTDNMSTITNSNLNLDNMRAVLKDAGYSDVASDEIANAMQVLNLYGFISISNASECTNTVSLSNKAGNSHSSMVNNALSALNRSLTTGIGSGSQYSHTFSKNCFTSDFQTRGCPNSNLVIPLSQTTTELHNQLFSNRRSSFSSPQPSLLSTQARAINSNPLTATGSTATPSTTTISDRDNSNNVELKPHDPLCINSYDSSICGAVDTNSLEINIGLYSKLSTHPPINCANSTQVTGIVSEAPSKSSLVMHHDEEEDTTTTTTTTTSTTTITTTSAVITTTITTATTTTSNNSNSAPESEFHHCNNTDNKILRHLADEQSIKDEDILISTDGINGSNVGAIADSGGSQQDTTECPKNLWSI